LLWYSVVAVASPISHAPRARVDGTDPVPRYDLWTPTTQVFDNGDGTFSATVGSGPIQAPDPTSDTGWSAINTDLLATQDGLEPQSTDADIAFSDGTDDTAPVASVSQDGVSLSIASSGDLPAPAISGDTATYADVSPGVDETLHATAQGFEASYVIDSPADAPASIDVPLNVQGLTASLDGQGGLVLTDPVGNQVGGADPAVMYGSQMDPDTGLPTVQQVVPATLVEGQDGRRSD